MMNTKILLYNFVVATLGVAFNGLVIRVITKRPDQDVTSFFVIVMSLADSLYLLSGPFTLFIVSTEHLSMFCSVYEVQTLLTHYAAADASLLVCIMATERYISIAFVVFKSPQFHRKIFKTGSVITSALLLIMYIIVLYLFAFKSQVESCRIAKSFSYFDIIIQFVLPGTAILVGVGYIIISFKRLNHPQTHAQIISVQTITFICLSAVFAIFSSPLYIFELWMMHDWSAYNRNMHELMLTLYNTQASMKLFVYISFEEEFRRGFVSMFAHWLKAIKKHISRFSHDCVRQNETGETECV